MRSGLGSPRQGGRDSPAQQPRSNSALRTHTNHHSPALPRWCNGLLREGSCGASWRGSLDGMQGVRGSNPLSSTRHNASVALPLRAACQRFARVSLPASDRPLSAPTGLSALPPTARAVVSSSTEPQGRAARPPSAASLAVAAVREPSRVASETMTATVDMGSLPDWVSAVGTLGAFAVALYLLYRELINRQIEREERLKDQASLVSGWGIISSVDSGTICTAVVRNSSNQLIYKCRIEARIEATSRKRPPRLAYAMWYVVPPGGEEQSSWKLDRYHPSQWPAIELTFIDARGNTWRRKSTGELIRWTEQYNNVVPDDVEYLGEPFWLGADQ
jgi:hypothetical protein